METSHLSGHEGEDLSANGALAGRPVDGGPRGAAQAPGELPLVVGQTLAGKYRIERMCDVGVGIVLAATHVRLDELVTVKLLRPEAQRVPRTLAQFARQAKISARVRSAYTVKVFDAGTLPGLGPYLVTEYLEGRDLAQMLADGPIGLAIAAEYALQMCEALAAAHASGIVHGHLDSASVFFDRRGDVETLKVLDFGLVPPNAETISDRKTPPLYLAPEQIGGKGGIDHRTDVWSLGVLLYEMVAGRTPFQAQSIAAMSARVLEGEPVPLGHLAGVAPAFEAVVARCLRKLPSGRYQDVAELAAALVPFAPAPRAQLYADRCATAMRTAAIGAAAGEVQAREVEERVHAEPAPPVSTIEVHPHIVDIDPAPAPLTMDGPAGALGGASAWPRMTPAGHEAVAWTQPPPEFPQSRRPKWALVGGAVILVALVVGLRQLGPRGSADASVSPILIPATAPRVVPPAAPAVATGASAADPAIVTPTAAGRTAPPRTAAAPSRMVHRVYRQSRTAPDNGRVNTSGAVAARQIAARTHQPTAEPTERRSPPRSPSPRARLIDDESARARLVE